MPKDRPIVCEVTKVLDSLCEMPNPGETMCEVTNLKSTKSPLLPDRHPTPDFFVCDIFDAAPKGDMASMEHPIFSLSTKPDLRIRRYEHGGSWIEIKPSADGMATVHDRDILIYCISQLVAAYNQGKPMAQSVRFKAHDLLLSTNRVTAGRGYSLLKSALERLAGTRISTNIISGDKEIMQGFGLIENYEIVKETREGRMQEIEIKLSDFVYSAIKSQEVLTLSRDYFRLRRPIERRLYEIARKHCGRKHEWRISLKLLKKKCGSGSTVAEFRRLVKKVVRDDEENNHMPDYSIRLEEREGGDDMVIFLSRGSVPTVTAPEGCQTKIPPLLPDTYHDARLEAPGWDVYELERQWRGWIEMSEADAPKFPDAAFVGFCRKWFQRKGRP